MRPVHAPGLRRPSWQQLGPPRLEPKVEDLPAGGIGPWLQERRDAERLLEVERAGGGRLRPQEHDDAPRGEEQERDRRGPRSRVDDARHAPVTSFDLATI
jgi:hypothetical protein